MGKRDNDSTPAEDYIDQLQWRSRHGWRESIRFEPKWKYKIVYRLPPVTLLERIFHFAMLIGIIVALAYLLTSDFLTWGAKIFFILLVGMIVTILFFAVRDISEDDHKKSDPLD